MDDRVRAGLTSGRRWLARHHSSVRDWLILFAAVAAAFVGWQQIADERNARKAGEQRLLQEARRSQAEKISAWINRDNEFSMDAILNNRSDQPVYQVVVWRVALYGAGARSARELDESSGEYRTFATLPPGGYTTFFGPGFHGGGLKPGVEIAFRDQAGSTWVRSGDGLLRRSHLSPVDFYGLAESQAWDIPDPYVRSRPPVESWPPTAIGPNN
jgi:hypothetical protein